MRHFVGCTFEFKDRSCKRFKIGNKNILIWFTNDEFYATREECPHQGASVECNLTGTLLPSSSDRIEYGMEGLVIRCPWHKWEFDVRTGQPLFGTEKKGLTSYPVIVEDNQVYVEVN